MNDSARDALIQSSIAESLLAIGLTIIAEYEQ
jgi:hypothetical protein